MTEFKTKAGNPLLLGATKLFAGANFAVVAENVTTYPVLRIYEKGTYNIVREIPFDERMKFGDVYAMEIEHFDDELYDYGYVCDGKPHADAYAKVVNNRHIWGKKADPTYSIFRDDFEWNEGERKDIPFDEAIIYRLHVKGFTAHRSSGVKYKGTFKGIMSKLSYLKELGVNVIVLMPAYDFDEIAGVRYEDDAKDNIATVNLGDMYNDNVAYGNKVNYWGYCNASYFAPKSSFAAESSNACNEFKELVQAVHKEGMQIIMDFFFAEGMKPYMIMDCIRYWVMEYHIDGVHINLNAVPVNMIKNDPILSGIKIIGDNWELVNDYYMPNNGVKHLGICNDSYMCTVRRFIKGDEGVAYDMTVKLKENTKDAGVINYLSTHNSFTLMDSVSYDRKHNEDNGEANKDGSDLNYSWNCGVEGPTRKKKIVELRRQQIKNALTILFTSQGTPMLMAGDEMGRSCNGNNNPYCQDNDSNYVDWNNLKKNREIYEFAKYIIGYRREHKVFHMVDEPRMMDYLSKGCPDVSIHGIEPWRPDFNYVSRCFGILYNEEYENCHSKIYIMFNMYWEEQEFNVPAAMKGMCWKLEFTTSGEAIDNNIDRVVTVPARAIVVLREV